MEIVNVHAAKYAEQHTTIEDTLLEEVAAFTERNHPLAHMLSGHVQGKFLEIMSISKRPKYILEIGTFTGYSALCLSKGLINDGELHTIELREEDANTASGFFSKSLDKNKIVLHVGNALEIIPTINKAWDIVFLDADKVNYVNYYELTLPLLNSNGLIIADNVLFHGEVLEENIKGKNAVAINRFNEHVARDSRTEQVMLTVRDGLSIIRKL